MNRNLITNCIANLMEFNIVNENLKVITYIYYY